MWIAQTRHVDCTNKACVLHKQEKYLAKDQFRKAYANGKNPNSKAGLDTRKLDQFATRGCPLANYTNKTYGLQKHGG